MFAALDMVWLFFTKLFSAAAKVASAADLMATSGEEMAHQHLEEARHKRALQQVEFTKQLKITAK